MTSEPRRLLMCPPDYYGIEYEINPWMSRSRGCDREIARQEWTALGGLIRSLGADVVLLDPQPGLPDLVFTANAGLICRQRVFLSRFRHPARQGETAIDHAWFAAQSFLVEELPADLDFEGAGDALFCGETLFGGYLIRSDARALQWLGNELGCRVIPLQLVDERYYHLDTCFCPIHSNAAIVYRPAFDRYGIQALERTSNF